MLNAYRKYPSSERRFLMRSCQRFSGAEARHHLGNFPDQTRHVRRVEIAIDYIRSQDIASAAHLPQESVDCSYKCDIDTVPDTRSETNNGRDSGFI